MGGAEIRERESLTMRLPIRTDKLAYLGMLLTGRCEPIAPNRGTLSLPLRRRSAGEAARGDSSGQLASNDKSTVRARKTLAEPASVPSERVAPRATFRARCR